MKKATAAVGMLVTAMAGISPAAAADNMRDPYKVREVCEQRGEGKPVETLRRCCASMLVVPPDRSKERLEAQCVKGQDSKPADAAKKGSK